MSASNRDRAKGIVGTLLMTGVGSIFGGWVLGVICFFVAGGLSLALWTPFGQWLGFHADGAADLYPDPSEDPKRRLSRLTASANLLEHELANFPNWWPAVKDENFQGKLPDGFGPTTHAEAMQALLFAFAQFFSAAWTYQDQCRADQDRAEVIERVDGVYEALGNDPGRHTDATLNSRQLHVIGERSTERWGEADARPIPVADFEVKLKDNPRLAEALKPLREFLRVADLDTEARSRLDATKEAVKRVKEMLDKKGYRR